MPAVSTFGATGTATIDALLGGVKWATASLTYSFPTSASFYGTGYGDGEPQNNFGALNATQQAAARASLAMYASVANLTFTQVTESASVHGDLRFAASDDPSTAWAYFPHPAAEGGDAWFNKSRGSYNNPVTGNYAFQTFMHETGHALGLKHPHEVEGAFGAMPINQDSLAYSVMSYRSYIGSPLTGYVNAAWDFPQTLMMHDIRAMQQLYGANFATSAGDTVYRWNPSTGQMTINGVAEAMPGGNRILSTVWDGGGTDTYDFSNYATHLIVNLGPGAWTTVSSAQLARLHYSGSQMAPGNIANALLYNGDVRSLVENAIGGTGNDAITGNQVANTLNGGGGADALYGLGGDDRLFGDGGNDQLFGDIGDDRLAGGLGDDALYGGDGADAAIFAGLRAAYAVQRIETGFRVSGADGVDVLVGIESVVFDDRTMSLLAVQPVTLVLSDVNGDGIDEVLWRYEDGRVVSWTVGSGSVASQPQLGSFAGAWNMDAAGDFNGDGTGDVLWRHASGYVAEWLMGSGSIAVEAGLGPAGGDWAVVGSGDFNGDGTDDVFWQHDSGILAEWLMAGGSIAAQTLIGSLGPSWTLAAAGDFNGDGTDDILWQHDSGYVAEWLMRGGGVVMEAGVGLFGPGWTILGAGDFNGDGTDDVLWRHDSGYIADWLMNVGRHAVTAGIGMSATGWTLAGTGDLDGDGTDDILWRDLDGGLHAWSMANGALAAQSSYDSGLYLL